MHKTPNVLILCYRLHQYQESNRRKPNASSRAKTFRWRKPHSGFFYVDVGTSCSLKQVLPTNPPSFPPYSHKAPVPPPNQFIPQMYKTSKTLITKKHHDERTFGATMTALSSANIAFTDSSVSPRCHAETRLLNLSISCCFLA